MEDMQDWTVEEIWTEIKKEMNSDPEPIQGLNVIYQYDLTGDDGGTWQLALHDGTAEVTEGSPQEASCTLKLSVPNFKKLVTGNLNGTTAFMLGKLKIKGDIGLALKLDGLLKFYSQKRFSS
ncbi:MAG: SCP2 sterol-binding domain-containing protein [Tuberibacillus sp.]